MKRAAPLVATLLSCAALAGLSAQTAVTPPSNKYTPAQDVELGQQAAQELRQQLPLMRDDAVTSYVEGLGRRLVGAIPPEFRHPEFRYTFEVVNVRDINASALPGGPMFVNRGMIETAHTEGEVAGVMAHELSHVILRHGTAQASKAAPYEVGSVLGQIAGAIIGGGLGQVVSGASQFGFGTAFLRFSRDFEKQADIEGSHVMAAAGYDARDMANVFKTIEQQSGPGGPQWMSDHPNPGNRFDYIMEEATRLRVTNPIRDTREFEQIQAHLKTLPRAPTTEEATKGRGRSTSGSSGGNAPRPTGRVERPSSNYRSYREGDDFDISVPSNWRELPSNTTVTFAPEGGYGSANGQTVFTHGVEVGIARNEAHDLREATDELLASLARGNPNMRRPSGYDRRQIDNRQALTTTTSNTSEVTGRPETIQIATAQLRDGNLLYVIGVAPRDEFSDYQRVFDRVLDSIRLRD